eukprot:NODE_62_length_25126_cov_0.447277.p1 type:complete len:857 gc:universal NODE_62_length_25126_cov_0.447277:10150-7580(-)
MNHFPISNNQMDPNSNFDDILTGFDYVQVPPEFQEQFNQSIHEIVNDDSVNVEAGDSVENTTSYQNDSLHNQSMLSNSSQYVDQLTKLTSQISNQSNIILTLSNDKSTLQQQLSRQIALFEELKIDYKEACDELESNNPTPYLSTINSLKSQVELLNRQVTKSNNECSKLKLENSDLLKQSQLKDNRCSELESLLLKHQSELASISSLLNTQNNQLLQSQSHMDPSNATDVVNTLVTYKSEIEQRIPEYQQYSLLFNKVMQQNASLKSELSDLNTRCHELSLLNDKLKSNSQVHDQVVSDLQSQLSNLLLKQGPSTTVLQDANLVNFNNINDLLIQNNNLMSVVYKLNQITPSHQLKSICTELKLELTKYKQLYSELKSTHDALEEQHEALLKEHDGTKSNLNTRCNELKTANNDLNLLQSIHNQLQLDYTHLQQQIVELRMELKLINTKTSKPPSPSISTINELMDLKHKCNQLQQAAASKSNSINQLNHQLAQLTKDNELLNSKIQMFTNMEDPMNIKLDVLLNAKIVEYKSLLVKYDQLQQVLMGFKEQDEIIELKQKNMELGKEIDALNKSKIKLQLDLKNCKNLLHESKEYTKDIQTQLSDASAQLSISTDKHKDAMQELNRINQINRTLVMQTGQKEMEIKELKQEIIITRSRLGELKLEIIELKQQQENVGGETPDDSLNEELVDLVEEQQEHQDEEDKEQHVEEIEEEQEIKEGHESVEEQYQNEDPLEELVKEDMDELEHELDEGLEEVADVQQESEKDEVVSIEEPPEEEEDTDKPAENGTTVPMEIIEQNEERDRKMKEEKKSADSFRDKLMQSSKRKTDADSESKRFKPTPIKFEPIKFDERKK